MGSLNYRTKSHGNHLDSRTQLTDDKRKTHRRKKKLKQLAKPTYTVG